MTENKCLLCNGPAPYTWFCGCCTDAKEEGYAEARKLGVTNYGDVMALREDALRKHKLEKHS